METQRIAIDPQSEILTGYLVPVGKPGSVARSLESFNVIGRDPSCQIVIKDEFVSSRHARIEKRTGGYVLRDLQSRNGTFLNGSRISEGILNPNDRIRFGETVFIFSEAPAVASAPTSKSFLWNEQLRRLPALAASDFSILITGPSGSGKEILAASIHRQSTRSSAPFISINCSALSESLIESELFGHLKGSFTGAIQDRKGAFESARGGTLFLDEIGDLPLSLQPKLLRALENNEIRPVGSDRTVETNVRILAATHKNLAQQVRIGRFREDLFYRLNVCQLSPPSLKERMEDFEDLVYHFAKLYRVRFSFNAVEHLKKHSWPGNIRELKNVVARASAYYPGKHIQPEDLAAVLQIAAETSSSAMGTMASMDAPTDNPLEVGSGSVIKEIEREMIIRRLVANRGNQRRTAMDLGMPKSTLHDRIKSYSIDLKQVQQETGVTKSTEDTSHVMV